MNIFKIFKKNCFLNLYIRRNNSVQKALNQYYQLKLSSILLSTTPPTQINILFNPNYTEYL